MNNPPSPPKESQLTPEQRKAFRRIVSLIGEHFKCGMISVVFVGTDEKFHIQIASSASNREQALDIARRTLRHVEQSETGLITTLTDSEKRIIE